MGAKMKNDKNSLGLLSSKRAKADTRSRADEAFALPYFPEATPMSEMASTSCKEAATEHNVENNLGNLKQIILQHETMFREQVCELHRLYQVQQSLMADSKGTVCAIHTCSGQPSSNSSIVYSSDSPRPGGEQCLSETTLGFKISFMQAHQGFSLKPDHVSSYQGHTDVKGAARHLEESANSKVRRVGCPSIDLERPAEEYVDGEEVESAGWERKTTDTDDGETFGNDGKLYVENETCNRVLFQHSGYSEVPFPPMVEARMNCPFQETMVCPSLVLHTDSLTGSILGLNKESELEGNIMSGLQRDDFNGHGRRRESQTPDPEAGSSSTEENTTWQSVDSKFHLATTLTLFPAKIV